MQMEKQTLTTLKVVPIVEAVVIPMAAQSIAHGRFSSNELQTQAAKVMLDELLRWAAALKTLRGCADQRACWRGGDQFGSKRRGR